MAVEKRHTVCNRDCPDACGLIATVDDGKLVHLGGDPDHPVTRGFICYRTSHFVAKQNSSERLTTPLLRHGDHLDPVSWDVALDFIAGKLLAIRDESGPAAILHYRSGGSLGLLKSVVDYFFELLGPVTVKRGDICSGAGDAAQETDFGVEESHDVFDLLNSRHTILWGKNTYVSNIHLIPVLRDARKRGMKVILIDPVAQKTASLADHVIAVRPGGDFALAMGAAALLFERGQIDPHAPSFTDHFEEFRALALSRTPEGWAREADVPPTDLNLLASALADRPCSIQIGWGMGRRVNGSAIVRALDALSGVSGNLGIPGGGASFYYKRRAAFDTGFLLKNPPRSLCEPLLGEEILAAQDPPIRAIWVTAGNPVSMLPDAATVARAFETRELVVVVDPFLTDTARRATVVLPTTTLVEDDDLLGAYGHHYLGASTPAVAPPKDVFSDLEIVQKLALRIDALTRANGIGIAPRLAGTTREWKQRLIPRLAAQGITVEQLESGAVRNPDAPQVLFADRTFPTDTGRMKLIHTAPAEPPAEAGFPLWLFSNSTEKAQSSQWSVEEPPHAEATCHPEAAQGMADGALAHLESALGRLTVILRFDAAQRRDVVLVPKGGNYDRGTCANILIRARITDAGEGAAYQDCRVRLVAI
ncbi:MAG: molybdopterin-dependent oxidoreductase [Thermoanaerobaculia bacterium]